MDDKDKINKREDKILGIIGEIVNLATDGEYIYRGQSDVDYPHVSSTLYREIEGRCPEIGNANWLNMNLVQEEAVKAARKFDSEASEGYDNKKMLSRIQHYSGDTNLIDFTRDCYVALFFACNQKYGEKDGKDGGKDGRIFLLEISDLKDSEKDSEIKMIAPIHPSNRVTAQKGVFIQSRTGIIHKGMMKDVTIPLDLKQPILDYLKAYHGISEYIIYNDLHGYIRNRKEHGNAVMEFYLGLNYDYKSDNVQPLEEKRDASGKAIKHYNKAIRLDPNYVAAYNNRGVAKQKLDDDSGAISDYDKVIELDTKNALAYYNRGSAKRELDDMSGAISDYDKVIELDPKHMMAYSNRGNAKRGCGDAKQKLDDMPGTIRDYKDAISDYDKAIELDAKSALVYSNRGFAKWQLGNVSGTIDYKDVISDYDKAIELDPKDTTVYNNRGLAKQDRGDHESAISDYDKAIAQDPNSVAAYYNRGLAKLKSSDNEGAINDFSAAIDLNPSFAEAYQNRGIAFANLQNFQQALSDLGNAKKLALQQNRQDIADLAQESIKRVTAKMPKS